MTLRLLAPQRPPPAKVDPWEYVSASRLNLWLKCPLAFKIRYVDGERTPTSRAAFIGKATHAVLEQYYRHRQLRLPLGEAEVLARIAELWNELSVEEEVAFANTAEEDSARDHVLRLVRAYLRNVPKDEPLPLAVEARVEASLVDPMRCENLGIPLVGVMDLVLDAPEGNIIADFKTSSRSSPPHEITNEIQLSCYSYLFRNASSCAEAGLEIRSLVKTKTPQVHFHEYPPRTERHFRRLFAIIRRYLDDLDSGRFVIRPGLGCSWCEFREGLCQHWMP